MLGCGHTLFPPLSPKHPLQTMPRKTCPEGPFTDPVQPACAAQPLLQGGTEALGVLVQPPKEGLLGARALRLPHTTWGCFVLCVPLMQTE